VPWDQVKKDLVKNLHPWLDDDESGTIRSEARAELLLRTHGFQAYSATAERVMDRQRDVFPYCQYKSMEDARVRPTHEALDGIVLPADHEFWATHTPPWDWGCRCMKIPLSEDDLGDIQKSDEGKIQDNKDILDEGAARELSATRRLLRNGVMYNVTAPAESGVPGSFSWTPGSLRLPVEELRQQYMAKPGGGETWHAFETMAKQKMLEGGVSLWDWLCGAKLDAGESAFFPSDISNQQ
jgi:SPP1 gp7 family putative phage head morphogenesis protein